MKKQFLLTMFYLFLSPFVHATSTEDEQKQKIYTYSIWNKEESQKILVNKRDKDEEEKQKIYIYSVWHEEEDQKILINKRDKDGEEEQQIYAYLLPLKERAILFFKEMSFFLLPKIYIDKQSEGNEEDVVDEEETDLPELQSGNEEVDTNDEQERNLLIDREVLYVDKKTKTQMHIQFYHENEEGRVNGVFSILSPKETIEREFQLPEKKRLKQVIRHLLSNNGRVVFLVVLTGVSLAPILQFNLASAEAVQFKEWVVPTAVILGTCLGIIKGVQQQQLKHLMKLIYRNQTDGEKKLWHPTFISLKKVFSKLQ